MVRACPVLHHVVGSIRQLGGVADHLLWPQTLENLRMEILVTLVLIGLVVFLFPYILAGLVIASGVVVGTLAAFVILIKKLFGR